MLPSMPVLYTRDSQDAFGNKIVPSTSYLSENNRAKTILKTENLSANGEIKQTDIIQNETIIKRKEDKTKPKSDDDYMESALVRSYYTKVQARFASHSTSPTNKFVQFRDILKSFDPTMDTPVDLYKKIEELFGNKNKDIAEEFLLFLKPCQAAEIGRFMDHFMLAQMAVFVQLLQSFFSRKPTVLRKVMRALTTGINNGNIEEMKSRVLPHLRSNARLIQMFKTLFLDERPPDSVYESGTDALEDSFLDFDKGYDIWEFEEKDNKRKTDAKVLDSEYLHGRVFLQHGRLLRTACVTYPYSKEPYRSHARRLAPNHCLSPPESDSERASPKRNKTPCKISQKRSKKQSPRKTVKDVNDNTKKDCLTTIKIKKSYQKNKKRDDMIRKRDVNKNPCVKRDDKVKHKDDDIKLKQVKVVPKVDNRSWTRDEDKTMLEVLKGGRGSEQVFIRISELLPHRTTSEIKERFCHVMNLLQEMAVDEVT